MWPGNETVIHCVTWSSELVHTLLLSGTNLILGEGLVIFFVMLYYKINRLYTKSCHIYLFLNFWFSNYEIMV